MQNTTLVSIICILTRSMHNTYYSGVLYELVVSIIYIYYTSLLYAYSLLARCYAYYSSCGTRVCILLILASNIMHNNSSTTSIASTHSITVIVL